MEATSQPMLHSEWRFTEETLEKCRVRYTGFGSRLYDIIRDQLPAVFSQLRFYQAEHFQTTDSYAICGAEPQFTIQLDPDCEVIVLAGENEHTEIGSWSDDPCAEAIQFISQYLINNKMENKSEQATPRKPSD